LNPLELTLGIMTAVGGFVDISELVFAAKAGSTFGYALIWVFAVGTVGIIVFSEMSGRVAAVAKQPVFTLMRHRLGLKLGLVTLAASVVSTLVTCAAEVGGVALILNYLTGAPYLLMAVANTSITRPRRP
jgi:Mn2+/Fe2+ NRAMP family transporter